MKLQAVNCETLAKWQSSAGNIAIVDIRDEDVFAEGHIPGACLFDSLAFRKFAAAADRDMPLVIVCYRGRTSRHAAMWLIAEGFTQVYSLEGGMGAWRHFAPDQVEQGRAHG